MPRQRDPIDKLVGRNIRVFRENLGLSQTQVARRLGITFQQVQKYENGSNRVGAGRLFALSEILQVPLERFFTGVRASGVSETRQESMFDALSTPHARQWLQSFVNIKDARVRRSLLALVDTIAAK